MHLCSISHTFDRRTTPQQYTIVNPAKSVFEVRFSGPAREFNLVTNIVRSLGVSHPSNQNSLVDPRNIRIHGADKRTSIYIQASRFAINIEDNITLSESIKTILDLSRKITLQAHWGNMARIGFRTMWAYEVSSFEELVAISKNALFKDTELISSATDVAMPLTLTHQHAKINYNYGPMKREELPMFGFEFPLEYPDCFAFIDVDYFREVNQPLSDKYLKEFLRKASPFINSTVQSTIKSLGI